MRGRSNYQRTHGYFLPCFFQNFFFLNFGICFYWLLLLLWCVACVGLLLFLSGCTCASASPFHLRSLMVCCTRCRSHGCHFLFFLNEQQQLQLLQVWAFKEVDIREEMYWKEIIRSKKIETKLTKICKKKTKKKASNKDLLHWFLTFY